MNSEEFVDVIKLVVRDSAIKSTLQLLAEVPGRKPEQALKERSAWFNSLDLEDRHHVEGVVAQAVDRQSLASSALSMALALSKMDQTRER